MGKRTKEIVLEYDAEAEFLREARGALNHAETCVLLLDAGEWCAIWGDAATARELATSLKGRARYLLSTYKVEDPAESLLNAFEVGKMFANLSRLASVEVVQAADESRTRGGSTQKQDTRRKAWLTRAEYWKQKAPRRSFAAAVKFTARALDISIDTAERHLRLVGITAKTPDN